MSKGSSVVDCIGNTPLIRLNRLSDECGCEILGKAEFLNPGGSVKDRAALGMVRAAEASGELQAGGTIVEGTAGNTGIGLALVGSALGYRTISRKSTRSRRTAPTYDSSHRYRTKTRSTSFTPRAALRHR